MVGKLIDDEIMKDKKLTALKQEVAKLQKEKQILEESVEAVELKLAQWERANPQPSMRVGRISEISEDQANYEVAIDKWRNHPDRIKLQGDAAELAIKKKQITTRLEGDDFYAWSDYHTNPMGSALQLEFNEGLIAEFGDAYAEKSLETIGRIRELGGGADDYKWAKGSSKGSKQACNRAAQDLPSDWNNLIQDQTSLQAKTIKRGHFSEVTQGPSPSTRDIWKGNMKGYHGKDGGGYAPPKRGTRVKGKNGVRSNIDEAHPNRLVAGDEKTKCNMRLSADSERGKRRTRNSVIRKANEEGAEMAFGDRVATHEFMHALEYSSGDILQQLEYEFLISRWEVAESLKAYEQGTFALQDKFFSDYSGKMYLHETTRSAVNSPQLLAELMESGTVTDIFAEVTSMGVEGILHGGHQVALDESYRQFILGLLGGF